MFDCVRSVKIIEHLSLNILESPKLRPRTDPIRFGVESLLSLADLDSFAIYSNFCVNKSFVNNFLEYKLDDSATGCQNISLYFKTFHISQLRRTLVLNDSSLLVLVIKYPCLELIVGNIYLRPSTFLEAAKVSKQILVIKKNGVNWWCELRKYVLNLLRIGRNILATYGLSLHNFR